MLILTSNPEAKRDHVMTSPRLDKNMSGDQNDFHVVTKKGGEVPILDIDPANEWINDDDTYVEMFDRMFDDPEEILKDME